MLYSQSKISKSFYRALNLCHIRFLILALAAIGGFNNPALGQCELQTIWSPDGGGQNYAFGGAAASSASMDVIILGENGRDNLSGAAYIYRLSDNQWQLEEMFIASDGRQFGAQFGRRADMSADGKTVIISEVLDANHGMFDVGAVWVYVEEGGNWVVQQKLTASDAEDDWVFGEQVAISADGRVAAISATGAPYDPIYVFTRDGQVWSEAAILRGNGWAFGLPWIDLSADGSIIAVGAEGDLEMGQGVGAAYIFIRQGINGPWLLRQKLFSSDLEEHANFGFSVSLSSTGETLIASAIDASGENTVESGAVYVFERNGDLWFEQFKLIASDAQTQDHFGATTSLTPDGQRAIIFSSNNAPYVFDVKDGKWVETMRLTASDPDVVGLGNAIAITDDGSTALIGASSAKVDGVFWYGAAALFDLQAPLGDLDCDGAISTIDLLILLSNWGDYDCPGLGGGLGDLDLDCLIGTSDLLILLSNWG